MSLLSQLASLSWSSSWTGWFRSLISESDATLLKGCGHMRPGPPLDVVWAVSTNVHLGYIHVWPSSHQPVIQGPSRDSVSDSVLVLNFTQRLHKGIGLIHDSNSRILFTLSKLVSDLSRPLGSSTACTIFRVAPLRIPVYVFFANQDMFICFGMAFTGCLAYSHSSWSCLHHFGN